MENVFLFELQSVVELTTYAWHRDDALSDRSAMDCPMSGQARSLTNCLQLTSNEANGPILKILGT